MGPPPSTTDGPGFRLTPPCIAAAKNNERIMVEILLAAGADVGKDGRANHLPFIIAAASGCIGVLERLLSAGADPEMVTCSGQTALNLMCFHGHEGAVELLLRHNAASVVSRCDLGRLPCDVVAMSILEMRSLGKIPLHFERG